MEGVTGGHGRWGGITEGKEYIVGLVAEEGQVTEVFVRDDRFNLLGEMTFAVLIKYKSKRG